MLSKGTRSAQSLSVLNIFPYPRRYRKSASVDSATPAVDSRDDCPRAQKPVRGWSEDGGMGAPCVLPPFMLPPPDYDSSDEMSRRLHLYETAFDSRVAAPPVEDVSNHALLAVSPALSSQVRAPLRITQQSAPAEL